MKQDLLQLQLKDFTTLSGSTQDITLSYHIFGQPLHSAPIVMINHALTGNSEVAGETGWWKDVVGKEKCIDTDKYTILAFNVPGNGYDGILIENYKDFVARDIARIFLLDIRSISFFFKFSSVFLKLSNFVS